MGDAQSRYEPWHIDAKRITSCQSSGTKRDGYPRIVVTTVQLRIEYHPASDGDRAKTPDDFVTVGLASRKLVHFTG